jgi:predicted N-acyltransferase
MSALAGTRSEYTLRMIGGARYIARARWDSLARRGYHRHAWFVTAESCGAEPRHIGVYSGRDLVAVIPAYIERQKPRTEGNARWSGPAHRIAAALRGSLRPSLVIGAPMSDGSEPLGSEAALTEDVVEEALRLLEEEARAERVKAIVWPFIEEGASVIREVARRHGFRESVASSEAVLDVKWSSPEEYLASRAQKVQRTLRNELAWVHDQGIRITWETDWRAHASTFDALYRASYAARTGRVATLAPQFFTELAAQQSPAVRVQCAWKGSTLLEMAVALESGHVLDLCLRARSGESESGLLSQHCLCYDPIREAIAGDLTRIHLGSSALYTKVLRGAKLQARVTLARGLTPAVRGALRVLGPVTNVRNRAKHRRLIGKLGSANFT